MFEENRLVNVSVATLLKIAAVFVGFVFLYKIFDILMIFIVSLIIASGVSIWAKSLTKLKIPKILAILLIYLFGFSIIGLFILLILPSLAQEIQNFLLRLPDYYKGFYDLISPYFGKIDALTPEIAKSAIGQVEKIKTIGADAFTVLVQIFGGLASFFIVIVISFYLAFEERGIEKILRTLIPAQYEEYAIDLWTRTQIKLGGWLSGQIILGLIIGSLVFIAMTLIGVPYALFLGVIAAILEIVPFVGPVLSAVIGVIFAFTVSTQTALFVAIAYLIVQQVENHIIVPLLMQRMTGLNPIVIIISLMIGLKLGGILGMLVAVPIATIFGELFKDLAGLKKIDF